MQFNEKTLIAVSKENITALTVSSHHANDDGGGRRRTLHQHRYQHAHHQSGHRIGQNVRLLEDLACLLPYNRTISARNSWYHNCILWLSTDI